MKLLLFCENYRKGGLDTFLINLINNWPEDDIYLMINKTHDGISELQKRLVLPNNIIETQLFSRHNFTEKKACNRLQRLMNLVKKAFLLIISYPILFFQLVNLFSKYKFIDDLIIVNGGYPGGESCNVASFSWYVVKGKRSWYNFHNNALPYSVILKPFQFLFDYLLSKTVMSFVSVSKSCRDSMKKRSGIDTAKLDYIYNGISSPLVGDIDEVKNNGSTRKRIIMLSTFEERKGHEFIFAAMRLLPQYDLLVCGEGDITETSRIKHLSSGLDNIFLLGYRTDSVNIIATSDLLVVPSKENESFGLTIIEAMGLNTAVIATNVGGMKEVIEHGVDGLLVDYGDVEQLKLHIINIMEDDVFRTKLIKNANQSFNCKYSADVMSRNYRKLLNTAR